MSIMSSGTNEQAIVGSLQKDVETKMGKTYSSFNPEEYTVETSLPVGTNYLFKVSDGNVSHALS